jgi:hypothetical protein
MPALSTLSPSKSPTKSTPQKRSSSILNSVATPFSAEKRRRQTEATSEAPLNTIPLRRPKKAVGEAWPINDLRVFDAPTEEESEINGGPMLKDIMMARGWKYSTKPCHGTIDKNTDKVTFFVKEFAASLQGQKPEKVFGKNGSIEDGYQLQAVPLPKHALWMLGWMPYRVPGTYNEGARYREDFCKIVVEHGANLAGKPGNYRICKFPGTETLIFKTHLTEAFSEKSWYPTTYIMPKDKDRLLSDMRARGNSRSNMWIGKPRNDYGGSGIRVYKGTDPELVKAVHESDSAPRSVIQHYLQDPHLVGGYKYHMRIHLVITNLNPLEAFVQENGQCLFATKPYTLSGKTLGATFDPPVHVTNMGLNSKPENKENFFMKKPIVGRGQQIRMKELVSHLAETQPGFDKTNLWQQILSIAKDTTIYLAKGIQKQYKCVPDRHFEIFGMDLMLDKDMKVWMCEVNTDPGLGYPDKEVLGSPNPDYQKEYKACQETYHDLFTLLGVDAGRDQTQGSLRHWFELDFSDVKSRSTRAKSVDA